MKKPAFSIIEALLAGALFVFLVSGLIGAIVYAQEGGIILGKRQRALFLAQEGIEATKNIKDSGFSNLTAGTYGLAATAPWTLSGASDISDIYTRTITVADVDATTKTVNAVVAWTQNGQRTGQETLTTTYTNWIASSIGNWANPNTVFGQFNITTTVAVNNIAVSGDYLYAVMAANNTTNFRVLNISNPALPTLVGTASLTGTPADVKVSGNYAYVATNNNNGELTVVNISNPAAPAVTALYNAPGTGAALSIFVSGTTVFLGRTASANQDFLAINVSVPGNPSLTGGMQTTGSVNDIAVSGNYAVIAEATNAGEMRVVSLATLATPTIVGTYNSAGNGLGATVDLEGNLAILGTNLSNIHMINIATPATPALLGTYAFGAAVQSVDYDSASKYLWASSLNIGTGEIKVLNLTTPATPALVGIYDYTTSINDVVYDPARDLAFCGTILTTMEIIIVQP